MGASVCIEGIGGTQQCGQHRCADEIDVFRESSRQKGMPFASSFAFDSGVISVVFKDMN